MCVYASDKLTLGNFFLDQVKHVVFDKTGTLTHGKPRVVNFQTTATDMYSRTKTLAILGTAESGSEHPLGQSVVEYAKAVSNDSLTVHGCPP